MVLNSCSTAVLAAAFCVLALCCCGRAEVVQNQQTDRSIDAGTHIFPTHPTSIYYFEEPSPVRRGLFGSLLNDLHKACARVDSAVFKGGFEGTDIWQIQCSDSGEWAVTFSPEVPVTAESCRASPKTCLSTWASVEPHPSVTD